MCRTERKLAMERGSRVRELKAGIERVQGMPWHCQDLFILDDNSEASCGACDPLPDDTELSGGCPLVLCARQSGEWFDKIFLCTVIFLCSLALFRLMHVYTLQFGHGTLHRVWERYALQYLSALLL